LLANLFMHYAFDSWIAREFPDVRFERYCDDVVLHCVTERQAKFVQAQIAWRLAECRLELNAEKTRIVYCKDANRNRSHEHEQFDFLGYTFRAREVRGRAGKSFAGFVRAVSAKAMKAMSRELRSWRLHLRTGSPLNALAQEINPVVRGWINYYGRFHRSAMGRLLDRIDDYLRRWAQRKYKRLRQHPMRAWAWLNRVQRRDPKLFAHWQAGASQPGRTMGAG
jgi:RNA-directed DNA polymerase